MKKVITLLCSCILVASCSNPKRPVLDYKSQYAPARIRTISESEFRNFLENSCEIRTLKNGITTSLELCDNDYVTIFYDNGNKVAASCRTEENTPLLCGYSKIDRSKLMRVLSSYGFKKIQKKSVFLLMREHDGNLVHFDHDIVNFKKTNTLYKEGEFPSDVKQMLYKLQHGTSQEQYINAWYLQNDRFMLLAKEQYAGNNNYRWFAREDADLAPYGRTDPYVVVISSSKRFSDNFFGKIKLKDPKLFWNQQSQYLKMRFRSKAKRNWDPPFDKFYTQRQIDELN